MSRFLKRIRSGGVAVTVAWAIFQGQASAETLSDAMASAYVNSGLLEQNRALLRAADEDVAISLAALRPIIDWSASFSRNWIDRNQGLGRTSLTTDVGTAGLSGSQLLWDGGASRMNVQAAQQTVLASRESLRSIEQTVLFNAVQAYMNVVTANEFLRLAQSNRHVLEEELRASRDRFEVGEVTRTDVALSEAQLAAAESNVADARGNVVSAQATFVQIIGRPAGDLAPRPGIPESPASIDTAQAIAVQNHPDIKSLQDQISAADITVNVARASMRPTLAAGLDVGVSNTFDNPVYNDTVTASVSLSQRIYQGGALTAQIRRAIASRDSLRGNLLTTQRGVEQEVASAFASLQVAIASISSTEEQVRAAQVAFDGIREEARLGSRTTLDVLTAEQDLLDARADLISVQANRYIAAYRLVAAQGLLSAERLGLNVPIYDVDAYYNAVKSAPSLYSKQGQDLDRVLRAIGKE
ncbi:MAG: transporter [Rhodobacteraceae bacterium]|nr:transporter [Paracoccaceae bacterium]MAY45024.1 transporter [Paracoccaceae bacterium]QEW19041.1 Outer membrane efflux protein BepC precursor [Marinibacterium anthonyi]